MYPPIREVGSRFFLSPLLSPMFPFNRLLFHNTIAPRATMFLPALGGVMATALAPAALLWRVIAPPFPHRFRLLNSLAIALALGALLWWVTAPPFPRRFRLLNSRVAYHGHLGIDDICFVFDKWEDLDKSETSLTCPCMRWMTCTMWQGGTNIKTLWFLEPYTTTDHKIIFSLRTVFKSKVVLWEWTLNSIRAPFLINQVFLYVALLRLKTVYLTN